jgi:hypothetical protein
VAGGEESAGLTARDEEVFRRPRTPPRREGRPPVRADEEDRSEESDVDSASATTTSSFDDLSKDVEDTVRNS